MDRRTTSAHNGIALRVLKHGTMTEPAGPAPSKNMAWVPGGDFLMGSDNFYPEEGPVHTATVSGFWMDVTTVTNNQFRRFVKDTGYITVAERPPSSVDYPDAL